MSSSFFLRLREIIALELEVESEAMFGGEVEVDESYFGGRRKGRRVSLYALLDQSLGAICRQAKPYQRD
jgi:transposase